MDNNLMDNIMRELFHKRSFAFVDRVSLLSLGTNLTMDYVNSAINELITEKYVQQVDEGVKITKLGERFCLNGSFHDPNMPLVVE